MLSFLKHFLKKANRFTLQVEKGILCLCLTVMVALVFFDFVLRLIFHSGIFQAQKLSLYLMIWVGFIGASLATFYDQHLKIDFLGAALPARIRGRWHGLQCVGAALFTAVFAKASSDFVRQSYSFGDPALAYVPEWVVQAVMPISLLVIALRFLARGILLLTNGEGSVENDPRETQPDERR